MQIPKFSIHDLCRHQVTQHQLGSSQSLKTFDEVIEACWQTPLEKDAISELAESIQFCSKEILHQVLDTVIALYESEATHVLMVAIIASGRKLHERHLRNGLPLLNMDTSIFAILNTEGHVLNAVLDLLEAPSPPLPYQSALLYFAVVAWKDEGQEDVLPERAIKQYRKIKNMNQVDSGLQAMTLLLCTPLLSILVNDDRLEDPFENISDANAHEIKEYYYENNPILNSYHGMSAEEFLQELKPGAFYYPIRPQSETTPIKRKAKVLNQRCACGSGKKFKHCCLNAQEDSSPIPAIRPGERYQIQGEHLQWDGPLWHELASLANHSIGDPYKYRWLEKMAEAGIIDRIITYFKERPILEDPEAWMTVFSTLTMKDASIVPQIRCLMDTFPEGSTFLQEDESIATYLTMISPEYKASQLEDFALQCLQRESEEPLAVVDLCYQLLNLYPALGILLTRGEIFKADIIEAYTLLEEMDSSRERLGLSDDDPIAEPFESHENQTHDSETARHLEKNIEEQESTLAEKSKLIHGLQQQLKELEGEQLKLKEQEQVFSQNKDAMLELEETRRKFRQVKDQLKSEHRQKNQLQKHLKLKMKQDSQNKETIAAPTLSKLPTIPQDVDQQEPTQPSDQRQPVRLPIFHKEFSDHLRSLPLETQALALKIMGELASGSTKAFSQTRRLTLNKDLWRVRIGIHYRMIYRCNQENIHLVDIFHRKDLESFIKKS